jgi:hypothetical protein
VEVGVERGFTHTVRCLFIAHVLWHFCVVLNGIARLFLGHEGFLVSVKLLDRAITALSLFF